MAIHTWYRGHETVSNDGGRSWYHLDGVRVKDVKNGDRACARCGRAPTAEGHDACLGHIPGVTSACCGHGVTKPIMMRGVGEG